MTEAKLKKELSNSRFRSALIEAENRAEATAILIRQGYRVYRPEADYEGEDLLVRKPNGECVAVPLKSRLRVDKKRYGRVEIWMLFPSRPFVTDKPRDWYLIPHRTLFAEMRKHHGQTAGWQKNENWGVKIVPRAMATFLTEWRIGTATFSN